MITIIKWRSKSGLGQIIEYKRVQQSHQYPRQTTIIVEIKISILGHWCQRQNHPCPSMTLVY